MKSENRKGPKLKLWGTPLWRVLIIKLNQLKATYPTTDNDQNNDISKALIFFGKILL